MRTISDIAVVADRTDDTWLPGQVDIDTEIGRGSNVAIEAADIMAAACFMQTGKDLAADPVALPVILVDAPISGPGLPLPPGPALHRMVTLLQQMSRSASHTGRWDGSTGDSRHWHLSVLSCPSPE